LCRFVIPGVLLVTTAARLLSGLDFPGMRNLPGSRFIGTVLQVEGFAVFVGMVLLIAIFLCWYRRCPLAKRLREWK
ncbi:MAG: sodium-dependent transporter, partial [Methanolinea sp.]|nr:sodium-dependent transporter [Methanolinea sp.]